MATYYTPLADGEPVSASTFNDRFQELDDAIGAVVNSTVILKDWATLTGSVASINITGIPTGYKAIQLLAILRSDVAISNYAPLAITVNSDTTAANYVNLAVWQDGTSTTVGTTTGAGAWSMQYGATAALSTPNYFSVFDMTIYNYAETTIKQMMGRAYTPSDTITPRMAHFGGHYIGASAISSLQIALAVGGNLVANCKYAVYGIK